VNSPELRPLYEEARRRIPKLDRFQIQHVLREKNRHADRLANLAMDRGMGRAPDAKPVSTAPAAPKAAMLRGFVKGGVVHVLGGDLPDGIFVKVIPE
jgi:probable phosphoglycerate mutase